VLALGVRDDATVDGEVRQARIATTKADLAALADETGNEAEALRAELRMCDSGDTRPISPSKAIRTKALAAERHCLLAMRSDGMIGDEAFHRLEEELDFSDLAVTKGR
jgi:monovalent cation/hydrogen antiporter